VADEPQDLQRVAARQLSTEAHFALTFLQVSLGRITDAKLIKAFAQRFRMVFGVAFVDRLQARSRWQSTFDKGLEELMSFKIVEAHRDGHREWVIDYLHDGRCECGCKGRIEAGVLFMN
jgi:hypothetical protein